MAPKPLNHMLEDEMSDSYHESSISSNMSFDLDKIDRGRDKKKSLITKYMTPLHRGLKNNKC